MRNVFAIVAGLTVLVPATFQSYPGVRAQETNSGQKLYEAMEQKLAQAQAHRVEFEIDALEGKKSTKARGTLILAKGNRMKMTSNVTRGKSADRITLVSDGKTLAVKGMDNGTPYSETRPVPDKLFDFAVGAASRLGVLYVTPRPPNTAGLKFSAFRAAGKEQVGKVEANVIEYVLTVESMNQSLKCKLWLDSKTNLPLKRTSEERTDQEVRFRVIETYGQWELDPKLPQDTFTLPK
jgi:outer membrane lipoprotein-sorting protein